MPLPRLLLLFFASGAAGLIYQVVWMRALTLTLSVSVYAVTTVLCAFMGGLALGAVLAGRLADRLERPLLAFGLVEMGVGVTGLLSLGVLFELGPAYAWLHDALGGAGGGLLLARFLLASAVLLVPTTLMGTTLPLLARAAISEEGVVGSRAGGLYAVNTLGAVAGCVAAGFALIPAFGLRGTTLVAVATNIAVGALAVALGRNARRSIGSIPVTAPEARRRASGSARLAVLAFGASGLTAMGYEVLWTRALEQFTHNSTYAYTAMLATFLVGIGVGSAAVASRADRVRQPLAAYGALQIGIGVSVVAGLLLYQKLLYWIPGAVSAVGGIQSWARAVVLLFSVPTLTLLATTLCFGAAFPFVARAVVESVDRVGQRVALAYTVNTLGSIVGAVAVGFWWLPTLGMRGSFLLLVAINLAAGLLLVRSGAPSRLPLAGAVAALAALAALAWVPSSLFEDLFRARYGKLLVYREQVTDIVMVTEDKGGSRLIRYGDGRGTAGTVTFREDRSYAHLALLFHPDPKRILNICFGVGNSLSSVTQYPVEHVDQVELSPGVIFAAPYFESTNRGVLRDPRVRLTIEDGRNYLLGSHERWDAIRLDPPELHTAGIVNLYTREFFELARDHLAPGGIFSIWVNIAYTPESDMRMILRTANEVFPHVTVWHGPWLYSWVINGSVDPRPPDFALLEKWFSDPKVRADLASIPIRDPFQLLNHFVMAGAEVAEFAAGYEAITDDRTRLDFTVPRSIEAFFGISNSITDYFLTDAIDSQAQVIQRAVNYCKYKQPVFPWLANPEASGLPVEDVRRRLDEQLGSLTAGGCVGPAQARAAAQTSQAIQVH